MSPAVPDSPNSPPNPPPAPLPPTASSGEIYDLIIIGAGPGGLATLSAAVEPYSIDKMENVENVSQAYKSGLASRTSVPKVAVIDPGGSWISTWRARFAALDIHWLRSPAAAHPDSFDSNALLSYAHSNTRGMSPEKHLYDSGVDKKNFNATRDAWTGSLDLPSNELFEAFCSDLSARLPHTFVKGAASSITGSDGDFRVSLACGSPAVRSRSVVLALGVPGAAMVPEALRGLPPSLCFHSDEKLGGRLSELRGKGSVLVIGGGLTAVQVAQLAIKRGCSKVTLVSRRPLTTRHFDVEVKWFDPRQGASVMQYGFFDEPLERRAAACKEARGGGSVPPLYMDDVRRLEAAGQLERVVGDVLVSSHSSDSVSVVVNGKPHEFDVIVNACGHKPSCLDLPLLKDLQTRAPVETVSGFPVLSSDLQWGDYENLFVVGALASLQVGPDAGNLMGCGRAAQIVTDAMALTAHGVDKAFSKYKNGERETQGWYKTNRFAEAFDSSSSEEESESEAEAEVEVEVEVEVQLGLA